MKVLGKNNKAIVSNNTAFEIPEPTGTIDITANGTYDVADYASADVAVPMPDEYPIGGSLADKTLTGYKFKDGITSIGNYAFNGCSRLVLTSLPDSLTTIGNNAFSYCANLSLTSLPNSITSIGDTAFQGATNVALTSLPDNITSIGVNAFNSTRVAFTLIPDSLTSLTIGVFGNCGSLTSITFEGTPNSVSDRAFQNCRNILNIYVPWSEGEVANAPWGASNATIHYNHTGGNV